VILHHARRTNSLTDLVITKLDILSGFEEIPVCVGYEWEGQRINYFPADLDDLAQCRPIYEILPGWAEDIMGVRNLEQLPENAQRYVSFIAEQVGVPISYISVGPAREQSIAVD
jgi:adenylosuccinate synthase